MIASLHRISLGLLAAFLSLALATGYWGLLRGPALTGRADNPRLFIAESRVRRGAIVGRDGAALAETRGVPGDYERVYPMPAAAHVVGYASLRFGVSGIEQAENEVLRGDAGRDPVDRIWEGEVLGRPQFGLDVQLTLEAALQQAATGALADNVGSVVVLDAATGEVLALVSAPRFDPNRLDEEWEVLVADPGAPLLNRATLGSYQPGGALQPILLAAAFERNLALADQPAPNAAQSIAWQGGQLRCASEPAGPVTLAEALALACPAPLADLGAALGPDGVGQALADFGLYTAPGINLETAASPFEPIPPNEAGLRLAAAGLGDLRVSPLQMALAAAALANNGMVPPLQLVAAAWAADGQWAPRAAIGQSRAAVSAASARAVSGLFARATGADAATGVAGHASSSLTGPEAEPLGWYLGFVSSGSRTLVVVAAVENSTAERAAAIGLAVLGER